MKVNECASSKTCIQAGSKKLIVVGKKYHISRPAFLENDDVEETTSFINNVLNIICNKIFLSLSVLLDAFLCSSTNTIYSREFSQLAIKFGSESLRGHLDATRVFLDLLLVCCMHFTCVYSPFFKDFV